MPIKDLTTPSLQLQWAQKLAKQHEQAKQAPPDLPAPLAAQKAKGPPAAVEGHTAAPVSPQSTEESTPQLTSQSTSRSISRPTSQSTKQSTIQSIHLPTNKVVDRPKAFYITERLNKRLDEAVQYFQEKHGIKKVDRSTIVNAILDNDSNWSEEALDLLVDRVISLLTSRLTS